MNTSTISLKDMAAEVIKNLPESSSMEEIMYQLTFVAKIMDGLDKEAVRQLITTGELLKKMETWRGGFLR